MVDDVASLSVSGVASEGSSELLKTAKQGVAPSSNLSISYLMAKQREFHVIGKAGLDPKQVVSNYKVLKGCIKDVRDFVVEAEMRLHRQPTDKTSGSLARFKKAQQAHAKKDIDLDKMLQQVSYTWTKKTQPVSPTAAEGTTSITASEPLILNADSKGSSSSSNNNNNSSGGGGIIHRGVHKRDDPGGRAEETPLASPSSSVASSSVASRAYASVAAQAVGPAPRAEETTTASFTALSGATGGGGSGGGPPSAAFVESSTARRFYEVRAEEKRAYPTVAVVHAERSLERERARAAHQAEFLEAHDPARKFRAKKKTPRRKLVPHEGRGVSPLWSGSNPPDLGPGRYRVNGGGRRAGEICVEESLTLSPARASSMFLDATGRAYPPLFATGGGLKHAAPRVSMRSRIMARVSCQHAGAVASHSHSHSRIDDGDGGTTIASAFSASDVPTNQRGFSRQARGGAQQGGGGFLLRSSGGGGGGGGVLVVPDDARTSQRSVAESDANHSHSLSVWSLASGDSTLGKEGPLSRHVRPLTGSTVAFLNDGRPRIAHPDQQASMDELLDQTVYRARVHDYSFGALSYCPPREQQLPGGLLLDDDRRDGHLLLRHGSGGDDDECDQGATAGAAAATLQQRSIGSSREERSGGSFFNSIGDGEDDASSIGDGSIQRRLLPTPTAATAAAAPLGSDHSGGDQDLSAGASAQQLGLGLPAAEAAHIKAADAAARQRQGSPGRYPKVYPGAPPTSPAAFRGQRRSREMSPAPGSPLEPFDRRSGSRGRLRSPTMPTTQQQQQQQQELPMFAAPVSPGGLGFGDDFAPGSLPFPAISVSSQSQGSLGTIPRHARSVKPGADPRILTPVPSKNPRQQQQQQELSYTTSHVRLQRGFRPQTTGGAAMQFFGATTDNTGSVVDEETGTVLGRAPSVGKMLRQWKLENDVYVPGDRGPRTISRKLKRRPRLWE